MGSIKESIFGEYSLPLISPDTTNGDPWKRNYFAPPQHFDLVTRKFALTDIRPVLESENYSPLALLQSHGFGVVKYDSKFLRLLSREDQDIDEKAITELYNPEIENLVLKTTGAKKVFILATVLRLGPRVPTKYKPPTGVRSVSEAQEQTKGPQHSEPAKHRLAGQVKLGLAAPVRNPHMDFTPLGARQEIRSKSLEINEVARKAGIIDLEDSICQQHCTLATFQDSKSIIDENYNPGPRYAAYSIWRPLRKVQRDPLTLSPRREERTAVGENVYWPYENRIPGPKELNGDYLKEYAMLGTRSEEQIERDEDMKWYYVSGQEPDEVLFVKLFDSAALGKDSEHASAPWHASPDIGDVAGDEPRESIDVRVLAFW